MNGVLLSPPEIEMIAVLIIYLIPFAIGLYVLRLLIEALKKYLADDRPFTQERRQEQDKVRRTLAQELKAQRERCHMTQEFVAEKLSVSRQAVSKWETGKSEPSTSNLLALARLYDVDPAELLRGLG